MVSRAGFSLVEVIVAMVLLSVGMLAIAGSGVLAAQLLREAEAQEEMMTRATSVLDSLVIERGGAGRYQTARYRLEWSAADSIVRVRVTPIGAQAFELLAAF